MSSGHWEDLRRQARHLENELDLKLVSFAKLGANMGSNAIGDYGGGSGLATPSSPTREQADHIVETMSLEIQQLLDRLNALNERMSDCINSGVGSESSAFLHTLQRHRDIYVDYQREFEKTRSNIIALREREDLLGSVHRDIEAYHSSNAALMGEQQHLMNSERLIDQHLSIAASVRQSLWSQRSVFRSISGRMTGMLARFPVMNSLVQRINFRKRRDAIVLAGVTCICLVFMLIYVLR